MTVPLDELRTLLEAATPRPWENGRSLVIGPGPTFIADLASPEIHNRKFPEDAALIVAAVNHLDALIAEVERLREEAKPGEMPHECLNPECGTIRYGPAYAACPGCGGTKGRAALSQGPTA